MGSIAIHSDCMMKGCDVLQDVFCGGIDASILEFHYLI